MKTNTLKVIIATIVISSISLIIMKKTNGNNLLPMMAVWVSYLAVAVLVAVAAIDYRVGPKSYASR